MQCPSTRIQPRQRLSGVPGDKGAGKRSLERRLADDA